MSCEPQLACLICETPSLRRFDRGTVLRKYRVDYFRCEHCGFIQTEQPYWLTEAYSSAITATDIGSVSRCFQNARIIKSLLYWLPLRGQHYLDYGGGYGMLVRRMRDRGFRFFRYDSHCPNLFAAGFDSSDCQLKKFALVTAFEVFEHLCEPGIDIQKMLTFSDTILFSTELVPAEVKRLSDWHYFATHHGQHVSFFTRDALQRIAQRFNLHLCANKSLFLLSRKMIAPRRFQWATHPKVAAMTDLLWRRKSLLLEDWQSTMRSVAKQSNKEQTSVISDDGAVLNA